MLSIWGESQTQNILKAARCCSVIAKRHALLEVEQRFDRFKLLAVFNLWYLHLYIWVSISRKTNMLKWLYSLFGYRDK